MSFFAKVKRMLHPVTLDQDRYFLQMCLECAKISKDPATRVGSVIIDPNGDICALGHNSFPCGIQEDHRIHDRDIKLKHIVHAEMNAITSAAKQGIMLHRGRLYLSATDDTGLCWGGPPCSRCLVHVIQAGIIEIISLPQKPVTKWADDLALSHALIAEVGIIYREVELITKGDYVHV